MSLGTTRVKASLWSSIASGVQWQLRHKKIKIKKQQQQQKPYFRDELLEMWAEIRYELTILFLNSLGYI